ncbi:MAG: MtnX-like HAD-IB family phosphatase [Candidatus Zixiibacteriota bacterium]
MNKTHLAIFCDFDGTVARRDVGYHLYRHFSGGRNEALLPDWKAGRLSTRDCMRLESEMVRATPQQIDNFLDQFELDPTFAEFTRLCADAGVPVVIVSEGLDLYIRRLLLRAGLDQVSFRSNIAHLENGGIRIEFPYPFRICPGCGNCKAARIEEFRRAAGETCRVVFVGDGYSDACGARAADIVFAKKDLMAYCDSEKIAYNVFGDFKDVSSRLIQQGLLVLKRESG